jgi:LmbE family N-acetylglucosaminyl deacetylase
MKEALRLLCVVAHPDDESMGFGSTLVKYAAEGVETFLIMATRGERGWNVPGQEYPGEKTVAALRQAELEQAVRILIQQPFFLNYIDGEVERSLPAEAIARITTYIRQIRPQVVITFGPDGVYGHPDHIAVSQFATSAVVCACSAQHQDPGNLTPHLVSKFYYLSHEQNLLQAVNDLFGGIRFPVRGVDRTLVAWPDWQSTTRIDCGENWRKVRAAVSCHHSQVAGISKFHTYSDEQHRFVWGWRNYYRVFSLVNGGAEIEDDLFAGLR